MINGFGHRTRLTTSLFFSRFLSMMLLLGALQLIASAKSWADPKKINRCAKALTSGPVLNVEGVRVALTGDGSFSVRNSDYRKKSSYPIEIEAATDQPNDLIITRQQMVRLRRIVNTVSLFYPPEFRPRKIIFKWGTRNMVFGDVLHMRVDPKTIRPDKSAQLPSVTEIGHELGHIFLQNYIFRYLEHLLYLPPGMIQKYWALSTQIENLSAQYEELRYQALLNNTSYYEDIMRIDRKKQNSTYMRDQVVEIVYKSSLEILGFNVTGLVFGLLPHSLKYEELDADFMGVSLAGDYDAVNYHERLDDESTSSRSFSADLNGLPYELEYPNDESPVHSFFDPSRLKIGKLIKRLGGMRSKNLLELHERLIRIITSELLFIAENPEIVGNKDPFRKFPPLETGVKMLNSRLIRRLVDETGDLRFSLETIPELMELDRTKDLHF